MIKCKGCNKACLGAEESKETGICTKCRKNHYGGERAVCPECGMPNSDLYQFDKRDTRKLECSECHIEIYYCAYFPKSFQEAKEEYQKSIGEIST